MFNIVLYQPEIPPNSGNIIRLCANTGCALHLIEPLGFELTDKHLKRAGLDYCMPKTLERYESFEKYLETKNLNSIYLCTTKANTLYSDVSFQPGDTLVFGPETRGLPASILEAFPEHQKLKIPMIHSSRSLNLSNSVAVIVYEAWRQNRFKMLF
jgi:tRNA (cytidine/uridine-2'-O-)-methyltransferase